MAFSSRALQLTIQAILGIVIVGLAYVLYDSITTPYEEVERRKEVTEQTRANMNNVRQSLILYERANGRYVSSLDSLVMWFHTDSLMAASIDSLFGAGFDIESLPYSPRTGNMFELTVNDTLLTSTYLLTDPDSDDFIGTLADDITRLNAASWE